MANYDSEDMMAMLAVLEVDTNAIRDIVEVQGIDNLNILLDLDTEGIDKLCKNVRKPGGMVQGQDDDDDDDVPMLAHGSNINTKAEMNLIKTVYFLQHMKRTSRVPHPDDITLESIAALTTQKKAEKEHKNPALPDAKEFITPSKTWPKTIEEFNSIFRSMRGSTGIPLLYTVRNHEEPADDPAEGWRSFDEEMIYRAPITVNGRYDSQFLIDNAKVWEIISTLTASHQCYTQAKKDGALTHQDGRKAYWNIHTHYCGKDASANRVSEAKRILQTLEYHGEKKRDNFEKFISTHQEQHNIITDLQESPSGGIDELTKVMHLYEGVKCPELDNVRVTIFSQQEKYRRNFPACVELYQACILANSKAPSKSLQVAAVAQQNANQGGGKRKRKNRKGNDNSKNGGRNGGGARNANRSNRQGNNNSSRKIEADDVELRYYAPDEYKLLTPQARERLHKLRERDLKSDKKQKVRFSNTSAARSSRHDDDDSSDNQSTATPPSNNRTNPALTRQRNRRN